MATEKLTLPVSMEELLNSIQSIVATEIQKISKINDSKEVFTLQEAAKYLNISPKTLYKYTSSLSVPFSRPSGGKIYFRKDVLDEWLLSKSTISSQEMKLKAATY